MNACFAISVHCAPILKRPFYYISLYYRKISICHQCTLHIFQWHFQLSLVNLQLTLWWLPFGSGSYHNGLGKILLFHKNEINYSALHHTVPVRWIDGSWNDAFWTSCSSSKVGSTFLNTFALKCVSIFVRTKISISLKVDSSVGMQISGVEGVPLIFFVKSK